MRVGFSPGWLRQGVAGCGKHFPGLGGGTLDSHVETPESGGMEARFGGRILRLIES